MGTVVFLGSFDPPTIGHLHLITEALENGASQVVVIPAYRNPWKKNQTPFNHRLGMCRRMVATYGPPKAYVLDIESWIAERNNLDSVPTWMTLEELLKTRIGEFKILVTNETYREIPRWIKGDEILENYEFMILSSEHLGEPIPGSIEITPLNVSSTLVRNKLKSGLQCPEYLDYFVFDYIKRNQLYK